MSLLLRDFLPSSQDLTVAQINQLRQRLISILSEMWPQLDVGPNSVAGDLIVTPEAVLTNAVEIAMGRLLSDLDLNNIANGVIYNSDFVQAFLANFGVTAMTSVSASGVIKLTFSTNKIYVVDANAPFVFGSSTFRINPDEGSPITIYDTENASNKRVLTQVATGQYVVYLPVTGDPGAAVTDGSVAQTTLTHPELISVVAAGDFDSGTVTESLQDMARRAQKTFASSTLTSRSGAISFINQHWPQIVGSYVILTGDPEMIRSGANTLGVSDGAMDVFIKSRPQYVFGESIIGLTYDATQGGWVGKLSLPVTPAFYALTEGIFQTNTLQNSRSQNIIYSQSTHPTVDDPGISFSKYEELGIFIIDNNPTDFAQSNISDVTEVSGTGNSLLVTGEYAGYYFHSRTQRSVRIRLDSQTTINGAPGIQASVVDFLSGDRATVFFVRNASANGAVIQKGTLGYDQMLRGLDIEVLTPDKTYDIGDLLGSIFEFSFQGRTANFDVNYFYDPLSIQVDSVLQDTDNHPIGVDILVRAFMPCWVSQFDVNYRVGFGNTVNTVQAQQDIFDYFNTLFYPDTYEESRIGQILMNNGATGLVSVSKKGIFFPSLASQFVDQTGTVTPIPRYPTLTLVPPTNDFGLSSRNVAYIISLNTINFNGTVV